MATIHSLDIKAISDMTDEELLAHTIAVRQRRRSPAKELKAKSVKYAIAHKNNSTALKSVESMLKGISDADAKKLLTLLPK